MQRDSTKIPPEVEESLMNELVSGFVHEVKNPLASIKGALFVLRSRMSAEDQDRNVIEQIYEQMMKINRALSDLVDFTRLSRPEQAVSELNPLIRGVLDRVMPSFERQGIRIEETLCCGNDKVMIDQGQVELAFLYILSDIQKAMPEGGRVTVKSRAGPEGRIIVEIEDTGATIPEVQMERLFKPFLSTRGRGAGIGLSMAKRLLVQNGGLIKASNRAEEGMKFTIRFASIDAGS